MVRGYLRAVLLGVASVGMAFSQTTINGGRAIRGSWDASGATATQPVKKGASLPGTCTQGEVFFRTNAAAGQNLYFCTAANTWTQMAAGGAGSGFDPFDRSVFWVVDDFSIGSALNGSVGTLGWKVVSTGEGAGVLEQRGSDIEHPWVSQLAASGVGLSAGLTMGGFPAANRSLMNLTAKTWELQWIFKYTGSLTGLDFRVGATNDPTGPGGIGGRTAFGLRYTDGTDTAIVGYKNNDGTETVECTGSGPLVADTWYRVRMSGAGTATISFQMFNVAGTDLFSSCSFAVVAPSEGYSPFVNISSSSVDPHDLFVDWFAMRIVGLTR